MSLYTKDHNVVGDGGLVLRRHRHCAIELGGTNAKSVIGKVSAVSIAVLRTTIPRESLIYFETFDRVNAMAVSIACGFMEEHKAARACRPIERFE